MDAYEITGGIVKIPGIQIGCVTDDTKGTGVTVIVVPDGAKGAVDIAGGAPATRETPVLDPQNLVQGPTAIVLTGGSSLGLETADGVSRALRGRGRGFAVGSMHIPIVVAAAIFDLQYKVPEPPTLDDGFQAAVSALDNGTGAFPEGSVGAGTGATVGKTMGMGSAAKSGQAAATLQTADGLAISAIAVVNAAGSILSETGEVMAGPRVQGEYLNTTDLWAIAPANLLPGQSTTLAVVITNANLDKAMLLRVARMAHDGLARSIDPVHSPWDGDTVIAISAGSFTADAGRVGALAAHATAAAVRRTISQ